jgi:hypothetical protein
MDTRMGMDKDTNNEVNTDKNMDMDKNMETDNGNGHTCIKK